eukprot:scaffold1315_cov23-Tisochrysis_lutea.AAC.1
MQGRSWVVQASKWACLSSVSLIDNEQSLRVDDLQVRLWRAPLFPSMHSMRRAWGICCLLACFDEASDG